MSDDETQPVRPEGGTTLPPAPAAAPAAAPAGDGTTAPESAYVPAAEPAAGRRGFRERLRSLRRSDGSRTFGLAALIASALAGIIVGGLGLAAVHAITDDGPRDRGGWMQQRDGDDRGPGRDGMHGDPRGVPGQLPPTTAPEDEGATS